MHYPINCKDAKTKYNNCHLQTKNPSNKNAKHCVYTTLKLLNLQLMQTENITLYFKQGKSDKIYKAALEKVDEQYLVNFAYGRRGSTLKTGTKTKVAVPYEKAKKIYDKLIKDKKAKGYVPNEDGQTQYIHDSDQVNTGIHCQLLNPLEETELIALIEDDDWWAQEKKDGRRMLIQKTDEVTAINRKGLSIGAPESIVHAAKKINRAFTIDGEAVGETLFAFDLLALDGKDIRSKSYQERLQLLETLAFDKAIQIVPTAKTKADKQALHNRLKQAASEGLVFKNVTAAYTAGRPNSGGTQRKFKFYDTASVWVSKNNLKRSVAISVFDKGKEIPVGNVTIPVNKDIPEAGSIIEVRYLYAYEGGSLYQPTFLGVRTDIDKSDCGIGQLKYKVVPAH